MPRPIFAHKLHLTRVGQAAASTTPQSPVSAGAERWYGITEQNALAAAVDTYGQANVTQTGTATSVQDSTGSYINYASTTADNAIAGWTNTVTNVVQIQLLPDTTIVMKTGAGATDIADCRIWCGWSSGGGALDVDVPSTAAVSGLLFRYNTPTSDTTWHAVSSNGASSTVADTGVSVTANTRYVLRIKVVSTSSVEYYIDGVLVATLAATLPAAATGLRTLAHILNNAAGTARNIRLRKFYTDAL